MMSSVTLLSQLMIMLSTQLELASELESDHRYIVDISRCLWNFNFNLLRINKSGSHINYMTESL